MAEIKASAAYTGKVFLGHHYELKYTHEKYPVKQARGNPVSGPNFRRRHTSKGRFDIHFMPRNSSKSKVVRAETEKKKEDEKEKEEAEVETKEDDEGIEPIK